MTEIELTALDLGLFYNSITQTNQQYDNDFKHSLRDAIAKRKDLDTYFNIPGYS